MLEDYKKHCKEREEMGIPPLPLSAEQTATVINLLKKEHDESDLLLYLLKERVPAGVDDAAYVKAGFLSDLTKGKTNSCLLYTSPSPRDATLSRMPSSA